MPAAPWFVTGPGALLAAVGHWRAPDPTVPSPDEDWQRAVVDAVIPVHGNQHTVIHCLTSLLGQTRLPRRVMLVDDGGIDRDHSLQFAREFARANGVQLEIVSRGWSIGRAVTLKRQAREFDGDVLFVLDADTVLESPDYIERCVHELYQGVGIASACGTVLPLQSSDRSRLATMPAFRRWLGGDEYRDHMAGGHWWQRLASWYSDDYRAHLALVQQDFVDGGLMRRYGGVAATCGGAIAYRRSYLKDLFNRYEPIRGDDLTPVEDHFIALALASEGYRNIRVEAVARTQYPTLLDLPRDVWRWTTALLQGCHYFDTLLRSPLRVARNRLRQSAGRFGAPDSRLQLAREQRRAHDLRRVREAYRQPFGERVTHEFGRPIGTALLLIALERIAYPAVLWTLLLTGQWTALAVLVGLEVALTLLLAAALSSPQQRMPALRRGLLALPLRYVLILLQPLAMTGFAIRLWMRGEFRWHARRELDGVRVRRGRSARP
ncbi:MAG: glycosyltransferase [Lysobacter sp.]